MLRPRRKTWSSASMLAATRRWPAKVSVHSTESCGWHAECSAAPCATSLPQSPTRWLGAPHVTASRGWAAAGDSPTPRPFRASDLHLLGRLRASLMGCSCWLPRFRFARPSSVAQPRLGTTIAMTNYFSCRRTGTPQLSSDDVPTSVEPVAELVAAQVGYEAGVPLASARVSLHTIGKSLDLGCCPAWSVACPQRSLVVCCWNSGGGTRSAPHNPLTRCSPFATVTDARFGREVQCCTLTGWDADGT